MSMQDFHSKTSDKYKTERFEFLKCPRCFLILLGIPDSHIAFYDQNDFHKTIPYNLPQAMRCPKCKSTLYKPGMERSDLQPATEQQFFVPPTNG